MRSDEAQAILDEARETLARTAHVTVEHRSYHDDPLTRWAAGMQKKAEPAPVSQRETLTDAEAARWEVRIDGKISAAINQNNEIWREVVGRVIAEERKRTRGEVEKLDLRLSALLAEVTKRQTIEAATVIDLPMLPRSARRA